jgi:hypothetical protein
MGRTAHELIPAAILLDNPGITREEFVELLEPFKYWSPDYGLKLHGIGRILNLEKTEDFKKFLESEKHKVDSNGIALEEILFMPMRQEAIFDSGQSKLITYGAPVFEVIDHQGYRLGDKKEINDLLSEPVKKGELFFNPIFSEHHLVIEVLGIEKNPNAKEDDYKFKGRLVVRAVKKIFRTKKYTRLNSLTKDYPIFHPDRMYDFSQAEGKVSTDDYVSNFFWTKTGDKYYLDTERTFDSIKAGIILYKDEKGWLQRQYGYTDLILTAEAMKHRFQTIFEYVHADSQVRHMRRMFKKYPLSYERYKKAVWDSHSSLFAKDQGMTYSELLRWRLLSRIPGYVAQIGKSG